MRNAIAIKQLSTHLDEMVQERTVDLEQKLREITALNRFFQRHLEWRSEVDAHYQEVVDDLKRLAVDIDSLAQRAQAEPFANLQEMPSLDSEDLSTSENE